MVKGTTYHFLKSDAKKGIVLLVRFDGGTSNKQPKAHLLVLNRNQFEAGIESNQIIICEKQSLLPPWLESLEGVDLSRLDELRPKAKKLHRERVEERFQIISSTLRDFDQILDADDPKSALNLRARTCSPQQNESRFRLWVLTYLCFGRDVWVLLPQFHNIGHWDRAKFPEKKFGAPSIKYGKNYGFPCNPEMAKKCVSSFQKIAKLGKKMSEIYPEAIIRFFNCRIVTDASSGMKCYESKNGEPFPSYWQFAYSVKKELGVEQVQKTLYGQARHRTRLAASKGSFSEEISNLMERVEADGYYIQERPKGYLEGSSLPPLCAVTARDVLSGLKLGIGFALGKETGEAYRMMLFSMAVPKDFFCSLFGIKIEAGEWPNVGLPGHLTIDRGPGARKDLIEELEKKFPIKDMAPSWSGQSKATIESSHPRDFKLEGQPTFVQSDFTPIELMKKEIYKLILYNNAANMEGRFEPCSELAYVEPSPLGLWNHYNKLFRNDAIPFSISDAVRTFLTPVDFSLKSDGVWLDQRRFDSEGLRDSGLLDKVSRSGKEGAKISGFMLDMCLRHVWIEHEGKLLLLEATVTRSAGEDTIYSSLAELKQWKESRPEIQSAFRVHKQSTTSEIMSRFEENTGKQWDSTTRRAGKPKRDASSRQEEAEVRQSTSKRKAA